MKPMKVSGMCVSRYNAIPAFMHIHTNIITNNNITNLWHKYSTCSQVDGMDFLLASYHPKSCTNAAEQNRILCSDEYTPPYCLTGQQWQMLSTLILTTWRGLICETILRIDSPSERPSKSMKSILANTSKVSIDRTHFVGTSQTSDINNMFQHYNVVCQCTVLIVNKPTLCISILHQLYW